jgi:hypothetical protein
MPMHSAEGEVAQVTAVSSPPISLTLPQAARGPDPLFALIDRASRGETSIPIELLDKLLEFREKAERRDEERAFDRAMADAQQAMEPVRRNASNPQTRSRYATYDQIDREIRPIYTKAGFAVSFNTATSELGPNYRCVLAYVSHRAGHKFTYKIDMPIVTKGPRGNDVMTETHATGSAKTYGERYLLCGIFNIALSNDDDGNGGRQSQQQQNHGGEDQISAKQVESLKALIETAKMTDADIKKMHEHFSIEKLEDMTVEQLRKTIGIINRRKAQQEQAAPVAPQPGGSAKAE